MYTAVKAIIRYNDYFFLQLRDNKESIPYPNRWSFFGGRLLAYEKPQTGLIREIKEELSFQLEKSKEYYRWYNSETKTNNIYFIVEMGKKDNLTVNEGQKGQWFHRSQLSFIALSPDVNTLIKKSII